MPQAEQAGARYPPLFYVSDKKKVTLEDTRDAWSRDDETPPHTRLLLSLPLAVLH